MAEVLWFYEEGGKQAGPIGGAALAEAVGGGRLPRGARVWKAGMAGWQAWETLPELAGLAAPPQAVPPPLAPPAAPPAWAPPATGPAQGWSPPPPGYHPTAAPAGAPQRQRLVYILLALFLGFFGVHNFYAGYTGRAVAQLLISLLIGWLIVPLVAVGIWVIVEMVVVTRDAQQVPFA